MEVFDDAELDRILALPRRDPDWAADPDTAAAVNAAFRLPTGSRTFKPIQVRALAEVIKYQRLFGAIGAGEGKALLSFVTPTALQAQRTLLLLPAKLRRQTYDVHAEWSEHFRIPPLYGVDDTSPINGACIRMLSYETLSRAEYAAFIEEYEPDCIICDEAHMLARLSAGRSKKVFRYVKGARKRGRRVVFIPLSGSFWRKRIAEAAYLMEAALENESPLPQDYTSLEQWGFALDEGVKEELRYRPGALLRLLPPRSALDPAPTLDDVRRAVRDRMVTCPGIVATTETTVDIPLIFQVRHIDVPENVREAVSVMRRLQLLPNGDDAGLGLQVWAHLRELGCGFSYRYKVPPPDDWKLAKRDWNGFVRDKMEHPGSFRVTLTPSDTLEGLARRYGVGPARLLEMNDVEWTVGRQIRVPGVYDTPLMVWNATEAGRFGEVPEFDRWRKLKDTFVPETVPDWLSDFLLKDAEDWALENDGIVWVSHAAAYLEGESDDDTIGKSFTRIPYFGAGDDRIRKYRGPCAASIRAHGTGLNLTAWCEALLLMPPSSGATLQQLVCRHWRMKQEAPYVTFHVYQHSKEAVQALITSTKDARFMDAVTGNPQGILGAAMLNPDGSAYDPVEFLKEQTETASPDPMFSIGKSDISDDLTKLSDERSI